MFRAQIAQKITEFLLRVLVTVLSIILHISIQKLPAELD
jgi:hypothetical protein